MPLASGVSLACCMTYVHDELLPWQQCDTFLYSESVKKCRGAKEEEEEVAMVLLHCMGARFIEKKKYR